MKNEEIDSRDYCCVWYYRVCRRLDRDWGNHGQHVHAMMQKGANKMSDHDCTVACVKSGQKYVLTSGDKVHQIENQSFAGLEKNAGSTVKATGNGKRRW
jgi:hypothetical protein